MLNQREFLARFHPWIIFKFSVMIYLFLILSVLVLNFVPSFHLHVWSLPHMELNPLSGHFIDSMKWIFSIFCWSFRGRKRWEARPSCYRKAASSVQHSVNKSWATGKVKIFAIHKKVGYQCFWHDYLNERSSSTFSKLANLHQRTLFGFPCCPSLMVNWSLSPKIKLINHHDTNSFDLQGYSGLPGFSRTWTTTLNTITYLYNYIGVGLSSLLSLLINHLRVSIDC